MQSNATTVLRFGAMTEVAALMQRHAAQRRVFFVVDEQAYRASGAESCLQPVLDDYDVSRFCGFELNPKLHDIDRGVKQCREFAPEVIIALGGGTAIDLAKMIGAFSAADAPIIDLVSGAAKITRKGPTLVAIPTTAGTGCEATHFAVAYIDTNKYSVADATLLPDYAIVDPGLTNSLPAAITASTGLDALCQAIESIWAVGATEESLGYATKAARLAFENLEQATRSPTPESRLEMCRASHLAGKAINISKTTAPHALSYPLTSRYQVPHGVAVALTLSQLLAYNAGVTNDDCADPRGADDVRRRIAHIVQLVGADTVPQACRAFDELITRLGCPASFAEVGVASDAQLRQIVEAVNAERLSNNPRRATTETLLHVLARNE